MIERLGASLAVIVLTAIAGGSPAAAAGPALFADKGCAGCHGEDGRQTLDAMPLLAGQKAEYLFKQMKDLAGGQRVAGPDAAGEPRTRAMRDTMADLSEADMRAMADWLATVPPPVPARGDAELAAEGAELFDEFGCIGCHGADGAKPVSDYPVLAGQNREYLALQIREIRDDVRTNGRSRLMVGFARKLNDEQIGRIAAYLSQIDRAAAP